MENITLLQLSEDWLVEATLEQMQEAMETGQVTAKQLVLMYLHRIAAYDKQGPQINAVLEINPEALHIAEALDAERRMKGTRGPLHGIPVLLKDNIETGDHMRTSAGSLALANHYATTDSFVAAKLRAAGAVLLGKANLTEWANFMSYDMPNGYSSRGGQVKNPYGEAYDVCGSSSGSAAAVAANLTALAVGSETSGSILSPAASNGIVGIKPTVGLISRAGIIPLAHSQDTAGPMARTVRDAAVLLGALTGVDERDPITGASIGRSYENYTQFLDAESLQGARIGLDRSFYASWTEEEQAVVEAALRVLVEKGATLVDVSVPHRDDETWGYRVLWHEFKTDLNAYLAKLPAHLPVHSLTELIAYHEAHAETCLKYGQTILLEAEATAGTLTDPEYIYALEKDLYLSQADGLDKLMDTERLDCIVSSEWTTAIVPAKAGYPSITVPAGSIQSRGPVSLVFTGRAYSEPTLIRYAYAFEQATKHRVPPKL